MKCGIRSNPILTPSTLTRVDLESIQSDCCKRDHEPTDRRELLKLFRRQNAAQFIGTITEGFHRFGFTKGQFSLVDIIRETVKQIGRADLAVSTWTVARADLTELASLLNATNFDRVRFLVDLSFQRRQPGLVHHLRETFGDESIRVTKNHAKFLLFQTAAFKIVCRTSMNLNFNPRFEDLELKDDPSLYDFIANILDEIFARSTYAKQAQKSVSSLAEDFAEHE